MASFLCLEVRKEARTRAMRPHEWNMCYRVTKGNKDGSKAKLIKKNKKKTKALPHCSGEPFKGYRWGADESRQQLEQRKASSAGEVFSVRFSVTHFVFRHAPSALCSAL